MRKVLDVIASYGAAAFPKQATLARRCGMPLSTLRKMLARLVDDGKLRVEQRGPTSSLYHALTPQIGQAFGQAFGQALPAHLFTELKQSEEEQSKAVQNFEPEMYTVNEFGRRETNPEWIRYQQVLRNIVARIDRARNPEAFAAAVLRAEGFGSANKRPGTLVSVSGEVAGVSGRLLASGETKAATRYPAAGDPAPMPPQSATEPHHAPETDWNDTLYHLAAAKRL